MNRKLILSLIIVFLSVNAFSQVLKYRVGANYGKFNNEVGPEEIEHPLIGVLSNPNSTDFTHAFEPGFEAELMMLWTPNIETGLEFEYTGFSGTNDIPPYRNYYFSQDFPDMEFYTTEPLKYTTSSMNIMLNFRYYIAPDGGIRPFFKASAGLSMVATELNYADDAFIVEHNASVIYALGTSNSRDPRELALNYGAGLGIDFKLSDKLSFYIDGTASVINSDKVDGIPNYNYIENDGQEMLNPVGNKAFITQVSVGLVFTSNTDLGLNKNSGGKKSSGVKRSGHTSQWRPFYRQK